MHLVHSHGFNVHICCFYFFQLLLEFVLSDSCGMDLTLSVSSAFFALVCAQQVRFKNMISYNTNKASQQVDIWLGLRLLFCLLLYFQPL